MDDHHLRYIAELIKKRNWLGFFGENFANQMANFFQSGENLMVFLSFLVAKFKKES
jgi:hypothetical protein